MQTDLVLLGMFAAITWGVSAYVAGQSGRALGAQRVTLATQLTNVVFIFPIMLFVSSRWTAAPLGWGLVSAVFGCAGFLLIYTAQSFGTIGVATKVQASLRALVPFVIGVATGDRPGTVTITGIALIIASVVLLATRKKQGEGVTDEQQVKNRHERLAFWLAFASGVAFGAGVVPLSFTSSAEGLTPLVSYRLAIALGLACLLALRRQRLAIPKRAWPALFLSGVFAAFGDAAFVVAIQKGPLSVVPAIAAMSPAITIALGSWLGKEHLRRLQIVGIALGLVGLVLIKG